MLNYTHTHTSARMQTGEQSQFSCGSSGSRSSIVVALLKYIQSRMSADHKIPKQPATYSRTQTPHMCVCVFTYDLTRANDDVCGVCMSMFGAQHL